MKSALSIQTFTQIERPHRQLARQRAASKVITEMQRGNALHLTHTRSGDQWTLSNGRHVAGDVARLVTTDTRVVSVNDGLFPATPQTWRFIKN
jgi:hypothetical protein